MRGVAAPLVSDGLWTVIEPLPPPEPPTPRGGRPAVPSRAAPAGVLSVPRSGIPWEVPPAEMGCGSGATCWRRLRDRQEAGVWDRLRRELLRRLRGADRTGWGRACVDGASVPAERGAARPGRTRRTAASPAPSAASSRAGAALRPPPCWPGPTSTTAPLSRACPTRSRPCRAGRAARAAGRKRPAATKPATTGAAAMRAAVGASSRASHAAGSRAAEGRAGTGGPSNARRLG